MVRRSGIGVAVGMVFSALCAASAVAAGADWQGEETSLDGVLHVKNPAAPLEEAVTLEPTEVWRLGGESEADDEIFGRVENVLVDEAGDVYILDIQLNEIRVFSGDGEYLRTLGRAGEGPGEFRNGITQFLLPGGRIGVMQVMPTRVALMSRDGEALSDLSLPSELSNSMGIVREIRATDDRIFLSFTNPSMSEGGVVITRGLVAINESGEIVATLKQEAEKQPPGQPIRIRSGDSDVDFYADWVIGSDGHIYVAPHYDEYKIYELDGDGDGTHSIITRDYESLERPESEIEEMRAEQEQFSERFGMGEAEVEINPYQRDISRLIARPNGELWVLSSRGETGCPEGMLGRFDVFDARGRYRRQLTLDVPYDARYDNFTISGDRLFVLKEANSAADQVSSSGTGGGQMMMIRRGGSVQADEDREPMPFEIVCYELPL